MTQRGGRRGHRQGRPAGEVVVGRNPVVEALRTGVPASALYLADGGDERTAEAVKLARSAGIGVHRVARGELDRQAQGAAHQGVLLAVRPFDYADPDTLGTDADAADPPLLVALDGITDPHNLGAIVRSVAAFGGHGVVVPERRSAGVTPAVWKASAGTVASVPVARTVNLVRQLKKYRDRGMFVVGLAGEARTPLAESRLLDGSLVLVVGAEGAGLSRLVRETCDQLAEIPLTGAAESLNASVAAGIAMYQIAQSRAGV